MNKEERNQLRNLALNMLGVDYTETEYTLDIALRDKYNISFDDFCKIVWDIMDYVPILTGSHGSAHVLGGYISNTLNQPVFLAIVNKSDTLQS